VTRITEEARKVLNDDIFRVLGDFHLLPYGTKDIRGRARKLRDEFGVERVAPAHCTGHLGFRVFRETFGDQYHLAELGLVVEFSN